MRAISVLPRIQQGAERKEPPTTRIIPPTSSPNHAYPSKVPHTCHLPQSPTSPLISSQFALPPSLVLCTHPFQPKTTGRDSVALPLQAPYGIRPTRTSAGDVPARAPDSACTVDWWTSRAAEPKGSDAARLAAGGFVVVAMKKEGWTSRPVEVGESLWLVESIFTEGVLDMSAPASVDRTLESSCAVFGTLRSAFGP
ncbi:hypothetical protein BST61_g353 [Cercospora zeina]